MIWESIIQYISWIIRIKLQFKRQLLTKRSSIRKEQISLRAEATSVKNDIRTETGKLELLAETVRYYWAKPIAYLNADICYNSLELKKERARQREDAPALRSELKALFEKKKTAISEIKSKKQKRRDIGSELKSMSDSHSTDQWRWNNLRRKGDSLTSDINSLSSDINRYNSKIDSLKSDLDSLDSSVKSIETLIASKKEERKEWASKREHIVTLIKQYDKGFPSSRLIGEKDEKKIIETRLIEIQQIRNEEIARAQGKYRIEISGIENLHSEKVKRLEARISELQTRLRSVDAELSHANRAVTSAEKTLEAVKKADTRSRIIKFFSESPSVNVAKHELEKANALYSMTHKTKESIATEIDTINGEIKAETTNYNKQIRSCKPRYLRPTAEEEHEEKLLMLRQKEIDQLSSGGR